jgi:hypothetical protein
MQEKEPQERLEGEQEGEELGEKEEQAQEGEEHCGRIVRSNCLIHS